MALIVVEVDAPYEEAVAFVRMFGQQPVLRLDASEQDSDMNGLGVRHIGVLA